MATTAVPGAALADDGAALAAKFGAREAVQHASLSPDGRYLAIVAPHLQRGQVVMVADLSAGGEAKAILVSSGDGEKLLSCAWPSNTRLVCQLALRAKIAGEISGISRMVSLNSDGTDVKSITPGVTSRALGYAYYGGGVIDWNGASEGHILMSRVYVPETDIGTRIAEKGQGLGVESIDVVKLARHRVEDPKRDAVEYISDGHGKVRIMGLQQTSSSGYAEPWITYMYRKPGGDNWAQLSRVDITGLGTTSGFEPHAVDSTLNVAYGFDDKDGRAALYRARLDGSGTREVLLARSDVDVDSLLRIGRSQRVVGASYATDRRLIEYFDPELKKLGGALGRALPGGPGLSFVDASADEGRLLIMAGSDIDPGKLYAYDKPNRKLEELLTIRPQLAGVTLAEMRPVSYPAADGTMIPAYLTLPAIGKPIGAIVMPHGGPSARDEWGFDWLVQFYAARGFAVLQPNYRGSAGYGTAWFQENGFRSWRTAIGDINAAGRWLVAQGTAAPGKLAIVGWSYGGYAALQSAVVDPGLFRAIVAVAPVTDLAQLREDHRDRSDFKIVDRMVGTGAHLREGSPAQNVAAIKVPVQLFHGDWDLNVDIGQSRLMEKRLKAAGNEARLVEFAGLAHSLDDSAARTRLLTESDAFLRRSLGLPAN